MKIVMLCSDCFSTTVIHNAVNSRFPIGQVITETPMRGMALAKRRLKKLGWFRTGGQILFSVLLVPFIRRAAAKRMEAIKAQYHFDETPIPSQKITTVNSVNEEACIRLLQELKPDLVIVNGTRIISRKVLESTNAVFINMHTGITPKYRGVHGGYWAMVNKDEAHCGVTIHFVDKGIDTGGVIYQGLIPVTAADNYYTYPYLQFGEGIALMLQAVDDIVHNRAVARPALTTESALWYHPTIWQYLYTRIFKGIK